MADRQRSAVPVTLLPSLFLPLGDVLGVLGAWSSGRSQMTRSVVSVM